METLLWHSPVSKFQVTSFRTREQSRFTLNWRSNGSNDQILNIKTKGNKMFTGRSRVGYRHKTVWGGASNENVNEMMIITDSQIAGTMITRPEFPIVANQSDQSAIIFAHVYYRIVLDYFYCRFLSQSGHLAMLPISRVAFATKSIKWGNRGFMSNGLRYRESFIVLLFFAVFWSFIKRTAVNQN